MLAIKRLIDLHCPYIILLRESIITWNKVLRSFSTSFPEWDLLAMDGACEKSGGLLTGWRKKSLKLLNSWSMSSVLGTHFFSREINFLYSNIYGPYHDRKDLWKTFFQSSMISQYHVLIRGDLHFTLGDCKIWGSSTLRDPLSNFFFQKLNEVGHFDIQPKKYTPTQRNMLSRADRVAKCLDRFLLLESLLHGFL
jgi:hypothetical protein